MNKSEFVIRGWTRTLSGIGAAMILLGCGGSGGNDTAAVTADSVRPAAGDSAAVRSAAARQRTPAMPRKWEDISRTEFDNYVTNTLIFNGPGETDVPRDCDPPASCNANNGRTSLDITPAQDTDGIDPADLDENGHVVAVLANKGTGKEKKYKIPANVEKVYWLVTANQSRFVYFDNAGNKHAVGDSPFQGCPPHTDTSGRKAGFKPCPARLGTPSGAGGGRPNGSPPNPDDPTWISCVPGCCVAALAT